MKKCKDCLCFDNSKDRGQCSINEEDTNSSTVACWRFKDYEKEKDKSTQESNH